MFNPKFRSNPFPIKKVIFIYPLSSSQFYLFVENRRHKGKYHLPLCFSFLSLFQFKLLLFSASHCSRLTVLCSVFNCSCYNFKACCDFVPISAFCTCFRSSRCIRFGLHPVSFTSVSTAGLNLS